MHIKEQGDLPLPCCSSPAPSPKATALVVVPESRDYRKHNVGGIKINPKQLFGFSPLAFLSLLQAQQPEMPPRRGMTGGLGFCAQGALRSGGGE